MLKTSQQPQQDSDKSDGVFSDEKEKQEMEKTGQALVASTGAFGKIHSCLINSICSVNGVLVVEACNIILTMPNWKTHNLNLAQGLRSHTQGNLIISTAVEQYAISRFGETLKLYCNLCSRPTHFLFR